jgi:putative heme transporter
VTERQGRRSLPASIPASTWWWIRAAAILITIFVAVQLLGVVQSVLSALLTVVLNVVFGAVIAFIAGPGVQLLERRMHTRRTLAILLTLFAGFAVVSLIGLLIASPIVNEASQLTKQGPALIKQINDMLNAARTQLAAHGIQRSGNGVSSVISTDVASKVAGVLLNVVTSTLTIALDILVTVVVAFWILKDGEQLRAGMVSLVPGRARAEADFFFDSFAVVVGGYVRGVAGCFREGNGCYCLADAPGVRFLGVREYISFATCVRQERPRVGPGGAVLDLLIRRPLRAGRPGPAAPVHRPWS